MRLDVAALAAHDPAALRELNEVCRVCARIGSSKVGAIGFADDISQDLLQLTLGSFLQRYDPERDVEPFLKEAARRMGLAYLRRHSREVLAPPAGYGGDDSWDPLQAAEDRDARVDEIALEDEADRLASAARKTLVDRMRARRAKPPAPEGEPPEQIVVEPQRPKRVQPRSNLVEDRMARPQARRAEDERKTRLHALRAERANRPDVIELAAIRNRLGLTQTEMARALGLLDNSIRSIEYGVVAGQPKALLKLARKLESQHKQIDANIPGSELIKRWCAELGLREGDTVELAGLLGLHRSTMFRWSTQETQPPPHKVRRLNAIVEALKESV